MGIFARLVEVSTLLQMAGPTRQRQNTQDSFVNTVKATHAEIIKRGI